MKKQILIFVILICFQNLSAQTLKEKLDKITTVEEAKAFISNNPELDPELYTIEPEMDTLTSANFKALKLGDVFNIEGNDNLFKVVGMSKGNAFRVSYIYLDGSKKSLNEINKLRPEIIKQYRKGTPFLDLVKKYTMDGNPTGELDWFMNGSMVPEFEAAVKAHKKGEIFTVDVPEKKWYYVTLKTHDDRGTTGLEILTVKNIN
ncbi:peptidylprolyl isomerase [Flavobacterium cerinum]|uniref:Peptidyl-prolyl cis-trans isomerase n=1 Tax=Flavobacterium cerinum TaxID=2502784 RepID=A0ABY5ISY0_9FLAO|nr:peptidylprolyl isomerase [Flavobacterium cerinum]UUC44571.1 peptidyl-prolyl cis-trans isomerase [Flavobacterium cerinum]